MANRNRGRGGRSRKRRPSVARAAGGDPIGTATGQTQPAGREEKREQKTSLQVRRNGKRVRPRGAAGRSAGAYRDRVSLGERPQAPWHPLPLSELLILVGSGVALLWFVWRVFLRKLWRVRRIENARLKRILAEKRDGE